MVWDNCQKIKTSRNELLAVLSVELNLLKEEYSENLEEVKSLTSDITKIMGEKYIVMK